MCKYVCICVCVGVCECVYLFKFYYIKIYSYYYIIFSRAVLMSYHHVVCVCLLFFKGQAITRHLHPSHRSNEQ